MVYIKKTFLLLLILISFSSYSQRLSSRTAKRYKKEYDYFKSLNHNYKNLETKKIYSVNCNVSYKNGHPKYYLNDKEISKDLYEKFESSYKIKRSCHPCILESYNENDSLIRRAISLSGSEVDWFIQYYPSGKIKQTGQFTQSPENPSWYWKRYVNDGQWVYYDEKGDTLYSEFWDKGIFIKQVPEQNETEVWKVDFLFKGAPLDSQIITANQIKEIEIIPRFKNSNKDASIIMVEPMVWIQKEKYSQGGINVKKISIDSLKTLDVNKQLLEHHALSTDKMSIALTAYNNGNYFVQSKYLTLLNEFPKDKDSLNKYMATKEEYNNNSDYQGYAHLVNSMDSTKKIKIMNRDSYDLGFHDSINDTITRYVFHKANGYIKDVNDTSVNFEMHSEVIEIQKKNGYYSRIDNSYNIDSSDASIGIDININPKNLNYLIYKSPAKQNITIIGGITIFASVLTLVAAPLVSIDYIHGGFNSKRCRTVAAYGTIGLGVGIPLCIIGGSKYYKLTTKGSQPKKGYWYLESN